MDQTPSLLQSANRLLAALTPDDAGLLQVHLEPVTLELRRTLESPGKPIRHVYFPETGLGSVVAIDAKGRRIEIGIFGRDGMSGTTVVLGGDRSPHETTMQASGAGRRIAAAAFQEALAQSPTLRTVLLRYVQALAVQTAYTALANGQAKLEERLARWLLMCHDRIEGEEMPLTHEFLSTMLGVRRAGVTIALHMLEGRGLIRATRGAITVQDREGLEEAANGSYGQPEAEYRRLFPQEAERSA
jgi:CRP-like cAMP-binding protein